MTTLNRELRERLKKASALYGIEFLAVPFSPEYKHAVLMSNCTVYVGYDSECIRFLDGLIKAKNVENRTLKKA